jgi:hypothetical protein
VHLFGGAYNRVDRAGLDAQGAADTSALINQGKRSLTFQSMRRVKWYDGLAKQAGKAGDAFGAAGRALVVTRAAFGDRFGVRTAACIPALGALSLRQQIFNAIGQRGAGVLIHRTLLSGTLRRLTNS